MSNIHGLGGSRREDRNPFARPPQAAGIAEPRIAHGNCKQVTSEKELDAALKRAAARLTVVHFYTTWYPPCFEMGGIVGQLSQKYDSVQFLRLDCEALPQIAAGDKYRIKGLPYLIFIKKQSIEDRLEGPSQERLEQTIMRLAGIRSAQGGQRLGSTPSSAPAAGAGGGGGGGGVSAAATMLMSMGFSEHQAQKGLSAVGGDAERAAAWLLDNPQPEAPPAGASTGGGGGGGGVEQAEAVGGDHVHQALCNRCKKQIVGIRYKCKGCTDFDLCGNCYPMRMMWHDEMHEFAEHATELEMGANTRPELTPEQKEAEVQRLKKLMEEKRRIREEEAKRQEKQLEMKRRLEAKNTAEHKRKWEEQKLQMEVDKARRQKEREEAHKLAVLEKIRRERGAKRGTLQDEQPAAAPAAPAASRPPPSECTLQIRGRTGQLMWKGSPNTTVGEVAAWASQQLGGQAVVLCSTYPKVVYAGDLANTSLLEAGLAPRGALVIQ